MESKKTLKLCMIAMIIVSVAKATHKPKSRTSKTPANNSHDHVAASGSHSTESHALIGEGGKNAKKTLIGEGGNNALIGTNGLIGENGRTATHQISRK